MDSCNNLLNRVNHGCNFAAVNHIVMTQAELDHAVGELTIVPESLNPLGFVHGGALATLADTVTGTAAYSRGKICVTLSCTMNYLAPAIGKKIICTATPLKIGKTISVYEAVLKNDSGDTVATGTFTFFNKNQPVPAYGE